MTASTVFYSGAARASFVPACLGLCAAVPSAVSMSSCGRRAACAVDARLDSELCQRRTMNRQCQLQSLPVEADATGGLVGNGRVSPGKTRLRMMSWSVDCSGPASSPIGLMSISSPR